MAAGESDHHVIGRRDAECGYTGNYDKMGLFRIMCYLCEQNILGEINWNVMRLDDFDGEAVG